MNNKLTARSVLGNSQGRRAPYSNKKSNRALCLRTTRANTTARTVAVVAAMIEYIKLTKNGENAALLLKNNL